MSEADALMGGGRMRVDEWLAWQERELKRKKGREKPAGETQEERAQGQKEDYGSGSYV